MKLPNFSDSPVWVRCVRVCVGPAGVSLPASAWWQYLAAATVEERPLAGTPVRWRWERWREAVLLQNKTSWERKNYFRLNLQRLAGRLGAKGGWGDICGEFSCCTNLHCSLGRQIHQSHGKSVSLAPHRALRHTVIFPLFKIKKSKINTRNSVLLFFALFSAKSSDTCWSGEAFKLQLKVILQLAEKSCN